MRYEKSSFSRKDRRRLYFVTALFSLALWLLLTVAEAYEPLHAWMHGGTIPENDDCAVVLLIHSQVDTGTADVPVSLPVAVVEAALVPVFSVFSPVVERLRSGRAPPVLQFVS